MLPEIISNEFCSLKPKSRRLAMTCEIHFDKHLSIKNYKFYPSLIYINDRFTYQMAEKELEKQNGKIYETWLLAERLIDCRIKKGRIDLNLDEVALSYDRDNNITSIGLRQRLRSHRLIEECMISANICAARFVKKHKLPAMHRVHEPIPEENLLKINAFLKLFVGKTRVKDLSHEEIKRALARVAGTSSEQVFNYLLLRSFSQAFYGPELTGHWGLALADYAHFTSPIRRYADLVLHRVIKSQLDKEKTPYTIGEVKAVGQQISKRERIALEAERDMHSLLMIRFMQDKVGNEYEGILTGFNNYGLFVKISDPPVEGFIPGHLFSRDGALNIISSFQVVVPRFSKQISLGARLTVKLQEADWDEMALVFDIKKIH